MLKVNEIDVYYGDLQALRDVSIEVRPGEIVSVIGSNGAGKSTLLKAISGMLRPRKGAISLNDSDISHALSSRIVEQGISPDTLDLLRALGHNVDVAGRTLGRTQSIMLERGYLLGATDTRRPGGHVAGY